MRVHPHRLGGFRPAFEGAVHAEWDERHDVDHADPLVPTVVGAEIEVRHGLGREPADRSLHVVVGSRQSKDGAVVVRVGVAVEERGSCGGGQPVEEGSVAPLADVDDALKSHGDRWVGTGGAAPSPPVVSGPGRGGATKAQCARRLPDVPAAQDPAALPLGPSTPDAVVDTVRQGVLEACVGDGALGADALGHLDPDPVAGEEGCGRDVSALPFGHPFGVHMRSVSVSLQLSVTGVCIEMNPCGPILRFHAGSCSE